MNFRLVKYRFLLCLLLASQAALFSQQSLVDAHQLADFNHALKLYNNKAYASAQKQFIKVKESSNQSTYLNADASYYDAMCAVKLNQTNADEKVFDFVDKHPTSNKKNRIYFNVGNYYFANKKAAHALKWYGKVNEDALSSDNRKELNFKMGYGLLVTKNLSLAKDKFSPLINDAKYGNDARYYFGFIAYKLEDYGLAESTLKEIADNASYKAEISYYLLDISFKSGQFERCIKVGKKLLETARKKDRSEISKIVGESHFNQKQYQESIPYLKAYKGKMGKWNNTDYYQLGYAYYKQQDFVTAIEYFNKIIDKKNAVAQNAYYHLAESYLKMDKKNEALNAFKSASEMNFNLTIQEDAALNYAKLSYEEGNPFENVADVLQNYLQEYPNSSSYKEINELVVFSYIYQQDYEGALDYLKTKNSQQNSQFTREVSLYRALQLFNEEKFKESLPFFSVAAKASNADIRDKAFYWEAEALYRVENFTEALKKFIRLKSKIGNKFPLINYQIGYCYFKLGDYKNAITAYYQFIQNQNSDQQIKEDAHLRLGDSYFANRNYKNAIKFYAYIIENLGVDADYALYQTGMSYGFIEENERKIQNLTKVVNTFENSHLKDDALYQLANTYTKVKKNQKAHQAYDRLLAKHTNSIFLPKALVRQGLLYYNENKNQKALEKFKLTTSTYPNTAEAIEAVRNAKNIYIDEDRLDAYVTWTKSLSFVDVSDSEVEKSSFLIAERKYFEGKNNSSILSLKKYLRNFPQGQNRLKATYYLGDILFKEALFEQAESTFKSILVAGQSEFSEDVLSKLSQIYLQKKQYQEAIPLLQQLEKEAYSAENILYAQSNLMNAYDQIEEYSLASTYAKKILSKTKLTESLELDAQIIVARAAFQTEDIVTAREFYSVIENKATGVVKAEALYYNALFKHQEKEYELSNEIVQDVIANYSAYKYWGVKSYIIMAKNYYSLKDVYQATFILENIIKNFPQFEDLVNEAKVALTTLKENEAKTNNSITPQNKN